MEDGGYRGGATPGGKWGCAAAALIGVPLFFWLTLINSLGDCAPDAACHGSFWTEAVLPTALVAGIVGLSVRWLVNRKHGDDADRA